MAQYLPITISAILIFTILMWWLLALGSVKKKSGSSTQDLAKDIEPPKAVPAPPVAVAPPAAPKAAVKKTVTAQLMDDPKPTPKSAPPKAQAPLKAAATKAAPAKAPAKAAKPAVKTVSPPKAAAPAPKAAKVKVAAVEPAPKSKAAAPKAAPKVAAKPKVAKVAIPDNLELLKGVGPKVNNMLKGLGITSFAQVANWTAADITEIDAKLGAFAGRINRDNWVDQAKFLVAGDVAGFEKKYGALGSEITKG